MPDTSVNITLTARDNATAEVAKVNKALADLGGQHKQVAGQTDAATDSLRRFVLTIRNDVTQAAASLNPAAGAMVQSLGQVTRGAGALGLGLGVAAAGVAVLVTSFTNWLQTSEQAARHQAELNIAVKSFDTATIVSALKTWATEIETLDIISQGFLGRWRTGFRATTDALGQTIDAHRQLQAAVEALNRVAPFQQRLNLATSGAARFGALGTQAGLAMSRAESYDFLSGYEEAGAALLTRTLERQGQEVATLKAQNEKAIAELTATPEGIATGFLAQEIVSGRDRLRALEAQHNAQIAAIQEARRRGGLGIQGRLSTPGAFGEPDLTQIPRIMGTEQDVVLAKQGLDIERERAQLLAQVYGLTKDEQTARGLMLIEAERQLKIEEAMRDPRKEALADLEASVKASALLAQQAERNDPLVGLAKGFRDVEEEFGARGLGMQQVARETASNMQRAFSDNFFDVITGNFKDLPNVAKQFTAAMVRTITDELSRIAVAPILGSLRNLLSGGLGAFLPSAGMLGAGSGGGASILQGSSLSFLVGTGGRPLPSGDLAIAAAQAGQPGIEALASGQAVISGGQLISSAGELAAAGVRTGTAPSLFQQFAGPALSAGALGFIAAGATQNTTTSGVFLNAGLGALAGAALGNQLAPLLGIGSGVGGAAGAIIGGGLTAALALFGKQQADADAAKARQLAEISRAAGAGTSLVSAAQGARSIQQLFDIITQYGSGTVGGSANPAVPVTVQTASGPQFIGQPNPVYPTATIEDLLRSPGTLQANIQAGVAPSALAGPNAATSQALQKIAGDLVSQFRSTEQGVGVTGYQDVDGVRRRTTVPATLADRLGQNLSIESPGFLNLSDDDKELLLRDLQRVAMTRDMNVFLRDPATDQIVSITTTVPSILPAPGSLPPAPSGGTTGDTSADQSNTLALVGAGGIASLGIASQLLDPTSTLRTALGGDFSSLSSIVNTLFGPTPDLTGGFNGVSSSDLLRSIEASGTAVAGTEPFTALSADPTGSIPGADLFGGALGGAAGLFSLVQGARTGDPLSILSGAYGVYSAAAPAIEQLAGLSFHLPTATSVFGNIIDLFAPSTVSTAAEAGAGAGAAAGTFAANLLAAGGSAAGATALSAGLALAAYPYIAAIINGLSQLGGFGFSEQEQNKLKNNLAEILGIKRDFATAWPVYLQGLQLPQEFNAAVISAGGDRTKLRANLIAINNKARYILDQKPVISRVLGTPKAGPFKTGIDLEMVARLSAQINDNAFAVYLKSADILAKLGTVADQGGSDQLNPYYILNAIAGSGGYVPQYVADTRSANEGGTIGGLLQTNAIPPPPVGGKTAAYYDPTFAALYGGFQPGSYEQTLQSFLGPSYAGSPLAQTFASLLGPDLGLSQAEQFQNIIAALEEYRLRQLALSGGLIMDAGGNYTWSGGSSAGEGSGAPSGAGPAGNE
jgi:hypothetical protein